MPRKNNADAEKYHIRALLRGLDVLEAFTPARPSISLSEISEAIGLNPSTTFRLIMTLVSRGYLEQDQATGLYQIGVAALQHAGTFLAHLNVRERVYPLLTQLRDDCRETVHLTVLDPRTMEVIYLEKLEGLQPIGVMSSRVGGRSPAYCTAVGKALLAYHDPLRVQAFFENHGLPRHTSNTITSVPELMQELGATRRRRYALDLAEHEEDVMCVAVPLWNHQNFAIAAVSVSGPVERITRWVEERDLLEKILRLSDLASRQLGGALQESH